MIIPLLSSGEVRANSEKFQLETLLMIFSSTIDTLFSCKIGSQPIVGWLALQFSTNVSSD